jgi:hypothetical protein
MAGAKQIPASKAKGSSDLRMRRISKIVTVSSLQLGKAPRGAFHLLLDKWLATQVRRQPCFGINDQKPKASRITW